jgi:hypothetical protein
MRRMTASTNPLWPVPGPDARCGGCAWKYDGGRGKPVSRCRRHGDARVDADWAACPAFEAHLDCQDCGACCREAYTAVEVSRGDAFVRKHPDRIVTVEGRLNVVRDGPRCACLVGGSGERYACKVYEDRPRTCRDFTLGSANCLDARRRVGLTR